MTKRLLQTLLNALFATTVAFVLTGCQTASLDHTSQKDEPHTALLTQLPVSMINNLIQVDIIKTLIAERQSLGVAFITNETSQYVDTHLLTKQMLRELLKANVIYTLAASEATMKNLPPTRLQLEGNVIAGIRGESDANNLQSINLITLRLVDKQNGSILWSETKELQTPM